MCKDLLGTPREPIIAWAVNYIRFIKSIRLEDSIPTKVCRSTSWYDFTLLVKGRWGVQFHHKLKWSIIVTALTGVLPSNMMGSWPGPFDKANVQSAYADLSSYPARSLFKPSCPTDCINHLLFQLL